MPGLSHAPHTGAARRRLLRCAAMAASTTRSPAARAARKPQRHAGAAHAGHTQALSRGLAVLTTLAATDDGATLSELARALALPAPTLHRLLATLEHAGYVEADGGGAFRIGVDAFRAGSAFLVHRNLVAQALPRLDALMRTSGETANLAVVDGGEAVFVAQSPCRELMRMSAKLGARAPLHASGVGKAMLASMHADAAAALVGVHVLRRYTPHTIVAPELLALDLAQTRKRGYAIDDEEHAAGLRCVAAAVHDEHGQPWAAVSLAGPTSRIVPARIEELGALVRIVAQDVTRALGGVAPR
jgi:IclR family transcriptional regulator, acetate operon repressor